MNSSVEEYSFSLVGVPRGIWAVLPEEKQNRFNPTEATKFIWLVLSLFNSLQFVMLYPLRIVLLPMKLHNQATATSVTGVYQSINRLRFTLPPWLLLLLVCHYCSQMASFHCYCSDQLRLTRQRRWDQRFFTLPERCNVGLNIRFDGNSTYQIGLNSCFGITQRLIQCIYLYMNMIGTSLETIMSIMELTLWSPQVRAWTHWLSSFSYLYMNHIFLMHVSHWSSYRPIRYISS